LAQALSVDALRIAVYRHVPDLLGETDVWLVGACEGSLEVLADTRPDATKWWEAHLAGLLQAAEHDSSTPAVCGTWSCYPLVAQERLVGVLGVDTQGACLSTHMAGLCETLGALLAIAIRNVQLFAETRTESTRDPLTGCVRRAPALEVLRTELRRSHRTGDPVSVILLDLDGFKQVNDTRGHGCGDQVLAQVGRALRRDLRTSDTKCRYGGDEFLVVLPETAAAGARQVAEAVRLSIGKLEVAWGGETVRLTASVGVATAGEQEVDVEDLVARADGALYSAKRAGRNCVRRQAGAGEASPPARWGSVVTETLCPPVLEPCEPREPEVTLTLSSA
jgi:diguanylate cyclase (GGDEF)-like protein